MCYLINNNLLWVSIPKNASFSIEHALKNSNLNLIRSRQGNIDAHLHIKKDRLENEFGKLETFCIKRDPYERFKSGVEYIWNILNTSDYEMIININDVDNNFIYNLFDNDDIFNLLFLPHYEYKKKELSRIKIINKIVKNKINVNSNYNPLYNSLAVFKPQNHWTNFEKCTYEFNINNLNELILFFKKKYNIDLEISKLNKSNENQKSKIILDNDMKNWIYNKFERPFDKSVKKFI